MPPRVTTRRTIVASACLGLACGAPSYDPAVDAAATAISLIADAEPAALTLPEHARPHAPSPPERIPLTGWTRDGEAWSTPNPTRSRNLFFFRPTDGVRVVDARDDELGHRYWVGATDPHWTYDRETISLHGLATAPADGDWFLVHPKATEREAALNPAASGVGQVDFVRGEAFVDGDTRSGLLLPAPASLSFEIDVPVRGQLRFAPGLVPPEIADGEPSDGAEVVVAVDAQGESRELWRQHLTGPAFEPTAIDLGAWEGQRITLTLSTEPGGHTRFDYVLLADPVVSTRKVRPRRAVLVFVDTLRPDHLGTYGYHRDTSPALDAQAHLGVRFDAARSVAPWTLPSARTMLTGHPPERYFDRPTLQGRLRDEGWATAMFAGNLYLGSNFGIHRDWGLHAVQLLPSAEAQLDRALAFLDAQEGRDAMVLVHLMDAHLPYKEPDAYRRMFAGDAPEGLRQRSFHRSQVQGALLRDEPSRQYVRDRYDNTIRYADDQLSRLYERLGPDDVLVFLSDHGEEFWDHGGYEHGHTLYDELLRVPLIVRGPGVPAGVDVDAPVSLLDVTPTVLDLLGLAHDDMAGSSLVDAMQDRPGARQALRDRAQAFGHPLYGKERWGVLSGHRKYLSVAAQQQTFDLSTDPWEKHDLLDEDPDLAATMRDALAAAVGRDVVVAYRLGSRQMGRRSPDHDLVIEVAVPGGVRAAWVGEDPTRASLAVVEVDGDTVRARWPAPYRGGRDVWIAPAAELDATTPNLAITASAGAEPVQVPVPEGAPTSLPDPPRLILKTATGGRGWELGFGITPLPDPEAVSLNAVDPETLSALQAMGYVVGDDEGNDEARTDDAP